MKTACSGEKKPERALTPSFTNLIGSDTTRGHDEALLQLLECESYQG